MDEKVKNTINEIIDKLHFRTFPKVWESVKREIPTIKKEDLRKILMERKKDKHLRRKQIKPYQIKIYSPTLNCWFMDLMDNGKFKDFVRDAKHHVPRYWHVFIGTNNRFAVVNPINSKDAEDVRQSLLNFILKYHPVKLTSDQESAFMEKQNVQMMKDMKVLYQTVPDKNHSTLGIIDRFIRTLRDMNRPTDGDKRQGTRCRGQSPSNDKAFKTIDYNTMINLVYSYNNTPHSAIKCTPREMFDDKELEKEYIFKCMAKHEKQKTIKDFELKVNDYVRYIISRDPINKKRYQVSNESYRIKGKEGKHYVLEAKDGTTIIKPRFQLIVCETQRVGDGVLKEKYKWGDSLQGGIKPRFPQKFI